MQSMTGFATETFEIQNDTQRAQITLNLKTLNARHFETNFRLPHQLFSLEAELLTIFRTTFIRGTISYSLHFDNPNLFKGAFSPDISIAQVYKQGLDELRAQCTIKEPVTLDKLISLPGVMTLTDVPANAQLIQTIVQKTRELVDRVRKTREAEGKYLISDLLVRLQHMNQALEIIDQRAKNMKEQEETKARHVLETLSASSDEYQETLNQAMYSILEKIEIHEEIVRLKTHIARLQETLTHPAPEIGKVLDFTLQEMGREINTIGAKAQDATISAHVIIIKLEIDKAREQSNNLV